MSDLLEVHDLRKEFPIRGGVFGRSLATVKAVDGVTFTVPEGKTLGIVGESGCGKTTVGRAVLRLTEPTGGAVKYRGVDLTALSRAEMRSLRRRLQIVFQDPQSSLNPRMSVRSIIGEPLAEHPDLVWRTDEERARAAGLKRRLSAWMAAGLVLAAGGAIAGLLSLFGLLPLGIRGVAAVILLVASVALGLVTAFLAGRAAKMTRSSFRIGWALTVAFLVLLLAVASVRAGLPVPFLSDLGTVRDEMGIVIGAAAALGLVFTGITATSAVRTQWREAHRRIDARVVELLERVGLNRNHADRYPHEFSGGQRQRIGVARALALEPSVIILDEPTSALDVSVQAQVLNLLRSLQRELKLTYVFISHDLSVIRHMADEVAVMYLGKIVEQAPVDEIFAHPQHPYTQALFSAVPVPDPDRRAQRIILKGDVPSPVNPPSGCRFHPRCFNARPDCAEREPLLAFNGVTRAACYYPGPPPGDARRGEASRPQR